MAGAIASKEDPVLGSLAQPVRKPIALVADGVTIEPLGKLNGRFLHVLSGVV